MTALARDSNQAVIQAIFPGNVSVVAVTSGGHTESNAAGSGITLVRVVATVAVHYAIGANATANHTLLPANTVEYLSIGPAQTVSFIADSTSGNAYVTEAS